MFAFDLKNLLQLSRCTEGPIVRHKRIQCGKISFIIYFELKDNWMTIKRAKRVRGKGFRCRRLRRNQRQLPRPSITRIVVNSSSQTCLDMFKSAVELAKSMASQTTQLEQSHIGVNTLDLSLKISLNTAASQTEHYQLEEGSLQMELTAEQLPKRITRNMASQTMQLEQNNAWVDTVDLMFNTSRPTQTYQLYMHTMETQTNQLQLEKRSTQTITRNKETGTQTQTETSNSCVDSTQTENKVNMENKYTQTTLAQDVQELLEPHINLLHLLVESIAKQENVLLSGIESIEILVGFKELELKQKRQQELLDRQKAQETQKTAETLEKQESSKKLKKQELQERLKTQETQTTPETQKTSETQETPEKQETSKKLKLKLKTQKQELQEKVNTQETQRTPETQETGKQNHELKETQVTDKELNPKQKNLPEQRQETSKIKHLQAKRAWKCLQRSKLKFIRKIHLNPGLGMGQTGSETKKKKTTPTDWKCTQTEMVKNSVIATQTDMQKGFQWLRFTKDP